MSSIIHYVSVSGGKDSAATACLALERAVRREMDLRFIFADTGNEHELTLEHIDYLESALGITIQRVRADFTKLFAKRREAIRRDWPKELKRKMHSKACREACKDLKHAERVHLRGECDCPIKISPPVDEALIQKACELMTPSGNPFLDMAVLHGRFPGTRTRFCTTELKLQPMDAIKDPIRMAGTPIVEWIGERADESEARAKKPAIEIMRCTFRAPAIHYRPLHQMTVQDVFAITKRHGLKPNPLYLQGMGRVGCMPCIMANKGEIREIAMRFPEHLDRIHEWEQIVALVSRRGAATFFPADKVPMDHRGDVRAAIPQVREWAMTGTGGRNFDLLAAVEEDELASNPSLCSSPYKLCE